MKENCEGEANSLKGQGRGSNSCPKDWHYSYRHRGFRLLHLERPVRRLKTSKDDADPAELLTDLLGF